MGITPCHVCGCNELSEAACGECGSSVFINPNTMRNCPDCQSHVTSDQWFCMKCFYILQPQNYNFTKLIQARRSSQEKSFKNIHKKLMHEITTDGGMECSLNGYLLTHRRLIHYRSASIGKQLALPLIFAGLGLALGMQMGWSLAHLGGLGFLMGVIFSGMRGNAPSIVWELPLSNIHTLGGVSQNGRQCAFSLHTYTEGKSIELGNTPVETAVVFREILERKLNLLRQNCLSKRHKLDIAICRLDRGNQSLGVSFPCRSLEAFASQKQERPRTKIKKRKKRSRSRQAEEVVDFNDPNIKVKEIKTQIGLRIPVVVEDKTDTKIDMAG